MGPHSYYDLYENYWHEFYTSSSIFTVDGDTDTHRAITIGEDGIYKISFTQRVGDDSGGIGVATVNGTYAINIPGSAGFHYHAEGREEAARNKATLPLIKGEIVRGGLANSSGQWSD